MIHLPHPALADEGGGVVMAESGADVEGHTLFEVRSIYPPIGAEVPFVRLFDLAFSATVALARQRLVKAVNSTAGRYRGVAVG